MSFFSSLKSRLHRVLGMAADPAEGTPAAVLAEPVAQAPALGTRYRFADDSKILFAGSTNIAQRHCGFSKVSGFFAVGDGELATGGEVRIDMDSVYSEDQELTDHLKNDHFFDTTRFPEAVFHLTEVQKSAEGYQVSGNFTLHGVEKNLRFPASASKVGDSIEVSARFHLNRRDWGMDWNGLPGLSIRDSVVVEFTLVAHPQK